MATRFYLPSTGAAALSPTVEAAWEEVPGSIPRAAAVRTRISSAMATLNTNAVAITTANRDYLIAQLVSEALAAQTLNADGLQTISGRIRCQESDAAANFNRTVLSVRLFDSGGTFKTNLYAVQVITGAEFATAALTNRSLGAGVIYDGPIDVALGDHLVFEFGARSTSTMGFDTFASMSFGDNSGSDLPADTSTTSAFNPWIEFSDDIAFPAAGPPAHLRRLLLGVG